MILVGLEQQTNYSPQCIRFPPWQLFKTKANSFYRGDCLCAACTKIPLLSRKLTQHNSLMANLNFASESQERTHWKRIRYNGASACPLNGKKQTTWITFKTSTSLCEAARATMWGVTRVNCSPQGVEMWTGVGEAWSKGYGAKRYLHGHMITPCSNSNLQSEFLIHVIMLMNLLLMQ